MLDKYIYQSLHFFMEWSGQVKSLILKCRMKGKFLLAIKIRNMFKEIK